MKELNRGLPLTIVDLSEKPYIYLFIFFSSQFLFLFFFFFILFYFKFYFIFKLNITVLDLPNIKMNPPQAQIET